MEYTSPKIWNIQLRLCVSGEIPSDNFSKFKELLEEYINNILYNILDGDGDKAAGKYL